MAGDASTLAADDLDSDRGPFDLDAVVAGLRQSRDVLHNVRYRGPVRPPPSRAAIEAMLSQLARGLFAANSGLGTDYLRDRPATDS